jgi:hypothetical protein
MPEQSEKPELGIVGRLIHRNGSVATQRKGEGVMR